MLDAKFKKIFIGVAWPYVNGDLHIGNFVGSFLPADISARYHRLKGRDVLMVSGSDCFGTPTTIEADKRKTTPKAIVDDYHPKRVELVEKLGISFDLYTKTDTLNHKMVAQDFFLQLLSKDLIFKGSSEQYYSETEKRFLPDRYVEGVCPNCKFEGARSDQCENCGAVLQQGELVTPLSKNTKTPVVLKTTEHYFLDWPKVQPFLEGYVSHAQGWRKWILQESKGWLKTGLKPREITRDLDWGVELPIAKIPKDKLIENIENKRLYVWFEAVIGYLSASIEWADKTENEWKPFWYGDTVKHYYFMGKDNLIFHTLFWPGQLRFYDDKLHLPDFPIINQFLNLEGHKFSKSRGLIVDPLEISQKFGNDIVRFYLCLIMPEDSDSNFSWDDFYEKVNNVLIGNFGNFVNRVLTLARSINFSVFSSADVHEEVAEKIIETFEMCYGHLDSCEFKEYLTNVLALSGFGNSFMSKYEPWKLKETNQKEFETIMFNLTLIVISLGLLVEPLLYTASKKLFESLGLGANLNLPELDKVIETLVSYIKSIKISSISPLFTKIEKHLVEEEKRKLPKLT